MYVIRDLSSSASPWRSVKCSIFLNFIFLRLNFKKSYRCNGGPYWLKKVRFSRVLRANPIEGKYRNSRNLGIISPDYNHLRGTYSYILTKICHVLGTEQATCHLPSTSLSLFYIPLCLTCPHFRWYYPFILKCSPNIGAELYITDQRMSAVTTLEACQ